jgi:hypothetical protein
MVGSARSDRRERRGPSEARSIPLPWKFSIGDEWPSGLRRTIGNRVDIVRVGSNPTSSVGMKQVGS